MPKHIVVTGCSQGLGLALIQGFIDSGHKVSGCSRNPLRMDALQKEFGDQHYFEEVDVSKPDQVYAWANNCLGRQGPVD